LMKKNQKIKAVFKSCDFATLSIPPEAGPKLAPPSAGSNMGALNRFQGCKIGI